MDTGGGEEGISVGAVNFGIGIDLASFERDLDRAESLVRTRVTQIQQSLDKLQANLPVTQQPLGPPPAAPHSAPTASASPSGLGPLPAASGNNLSGDLARTIGVEVALAISRGQSGQPATHDYQALTEAISQNTQALHALLATHSAASRAPSPGGYPASSSATPPPDNTSRLIQVETESGQSAYLPRRLSQPAVIQRHLPEFATQGEAPRVKPTPMHIVSPAPALISAPGAAAVLGASAPATSGGGGRGNADIYQQLLVQSHALRDIGNRLLGLGKPEGRAAGGATESSRPYLVGERGPELFMPRTAGYVFPTEQTRQMLGRAAGGLVQGTLPGFMPRADYTLGRKVTEDEFQRALRLTPKASMSPEGLSLAVTRRQQFAQGGEKSMRSGVFYLAEGTASPYTGRLGYGGPDILRDQIQFASPLVVRAGMGGSIAHEALESLGKGRSKTLSAEVRTAVAPYQHSESRERIAELFQKYGADQGDAELDAFNIVERQRQAIRLGQYGNQSYTAAFENITARLGRQAGFGGIAAISPRSGRFGEAFDLREEVYPYQRGQRLIHQYRDLEPRALGGLTIPQSRDATLARLQGEGLFPASTIGQRLFGGPQGVPGHIQPAIGFLEQQRAHLQAGRLPPEQVAAAYLTTLSSIRGGEIGYQAAAERAGVHPEAGTPLPPDVLSLLKGQQVVRPEDAFANWLRSRDGRQVIEQTLSGRVGEAFEQVRAARLQSMKGFGFPSLQERTPGVFVSATPFRPANPGEFNLTNIPAATEAFNAAGRSAIPGAVEQVAGQFAGIGAGKTGFLSQWLGSARLPTLDVNALQTWLGTQQGNVAKKALGERKSALGPLLQQAVLTRHRELQQAGYLQEVPEEMLGAVMHWALFDAAKQAKSPHTAVMDALNQFSPRAQGGPVEAAGQTKTGFRESILSSAYRPGVSRLSPTTWQTIIDNLGTQMGVGPIRGHISTAYEKYPSITTSRLPVTPLALMDAARGMLELPEPVLGTILKRGPKGRLPVRLHGVEGFDPVVDEDKQWGNSVGYYYHNTRHIDIAGLSADISGTTSHEAGHAFDYGTLDELGRTRSSSYLFRTEFPKAVEQFKANREAWWKAPYGEYRFPNQEGLPSEYATRNPVEAYAEIIKTISRSTALAATYHQDKFDGLQAPVNVHRELTSLIFREIEQARHDLGWHPDDTGQLKAGLIKKIGLDKVFHPDYVHGITKYALGGQVPGASPYAHVTEHVPIDLADRFANPKLLRTQETAFQGPEYYAKLRENIRSQGINQALVMGYNPNTGNAGLLEGYHRLSIAKELGHTHVPMRVLRRGNLDEHEVASAGHPRPGYLPEDLKPSSVFGELLQQGAVQARASGGAAAGRAPYLVGERGPELFVPNASGYVLSHQQTQQVMSMGARARAEGGEVEPISAVEQEAFWRSIPEADRVRLFGADAGRRRTTGLYYVSAADEKRLAALYREHGGRWPEATGATTTPPVTAPRARRSQAVTEAPVTETPPTEPATPVEVPAAPVAPVELPAEPVAPVAPVQAQRSLEEAKREQRNLQIALGRGSHSYDEGGLDAAQRTKLHERLTRQRARNREVSAEIERLQAAGPTQTVETQGPAGLSDGETAQVSGQSGATEVQVPQQATGRTNGSRGLVGQVHQAGQQIVDVSQRQAALLEQLAAGAAPATPQTTAAVGTEAAAVERNRQARLQAAHGRLESVGLADEEAQALLRTAEALGAEQRRYESLIQTVREYQGVSRGQAAQILKEEGIVPPGGGSGGAGGRSSPGGGPPPPPPPGGPPGGPPVEEEETAGRRPAFRPQGLVRTGLALLGVNVGYNVAAGLARVFHDLVASTADEALRLSYATRQIGTGFNATAFNQLRATADSMRSAPFVFARQSEIAEATAALAPLTSQYGLATDQVDQLRVAEGQLATLHGRTMPEAGLVLEQVLRGNFEAGSALDLQIVDQRGALRSLSQTYQEMLATSTPAVAMQRILADVLGDTNRQVRLATANQSDLTRSTDHLTQSWNSLVSTAGQKVQGPASGVAESLAGLTAQADQTLSKGGRPPANGEEAFQLATSPMARFAAAAIPTFAATAAPFTGGLAGAGTAVGGPAGTLIGGGTGLVLSAVAAAGAGLAAVILPDLMRQVIAQESGRTVMPAPTARASGGPALANATYMVGERGPELFVPRAEGGQAQVGGEIVLPHTNPLYADASDATSVSGARTGINPLAAAAQITGPARDLWNAVSSGVDTATKAVETFSHLLTGNVAPALEQFGNDVLAADRQAREVAFHAIGLSQSGVSTRDDRREHLTELSDNIAVSQAPANMDRSLRVNQLLTDQRTRQAQIQQASAQVNVIQANQELRHLEVQGRINQAVMQRLQVEGQIAPIQLRQQQIQNQIRIGTQENLDIRQNLLQAQQAEIPAGREVARVTHEQRQAQLMAQVNLADIIQGQQPEFDFGQIVRQGLHGALQAPRAQLNEENTQFAVTMAQSSQSLDTVSKQLAVLPQQREEQIIERRLAAAQEELAASQASLDAFDRALQFADLLASPEAIAAQTKLQEAIRQEAAITAAIIGATVLQPTEPVPTPEPGMGAVSPQRAAGTLASQDQLQQLIDLLKSTATQGAEQLGSIPPPTTPRTLARQTRIDSLTDIPDMADQAARAGGTYAVTNQVTNTITIQSSPGESDAAFARRIQAATTAGTLDALARAGSGQPRLQVTQAGAR